MDTQQDFTNESFALLLCVLAGVVVAIVLHFYKKLGYRIFKTDKYECGNIEIFYMEKIVDSGVELNCSHELNWRIR